MELIWIVPAHLYENLQTADEISIEKLIFPISVVDVSQKVQQNSLYKLQIDDVIENEEKFGEITENSLLICKTGWFKNWENKDNYWNNLQFPSISKEVVEEYGYKICGVGIDTFSPDCENDFIVHKMLLGKEKLIIENINEEVEKLPPRGAFGMALPLKISKAAESSVRFIAFFE